MASCDQMPQSRDWQAFAAELSVPPHTFTSLRLFRDLILRANRRFNLTALNTLVDVDNRLILDSLRLWSSVKAHTPEGGGSLNLVDIGSGSGIPGIPIAIAAPEWRVTMIEATGKKAEFISSAIEALQLEHATVIHGRSEDFARASEYRSHFDVALARAVGPLATLMELTMPLLRTGGRAFFPKGEIEHDELEMGKTAAKLVGGHIVEVVPARPIALCPVTVVVIADKLSATPDRFPRRAGIPAKVPLRG
ncbi:16S rRNA (guanine(527)-N(7))-methyltransferase RsmG [soil metagenome]